MTSPRKADERAAAPLLVVASHNRAKVREIADILRAEGLGLDVRGLHELPEIELPPERGETFAANAVAKAKHAAAAAGAAAVADDSGLEVEALGGEPGIKSARYLGAEASDEDRCRKILDLLEGVPEHRRRARFRCAAAYAEPGGEVLLAEGGCQGRIARGPRGAGGFGYDPIFVPDGDTRTTAELTVEQKHAISHRGRAFRLLARLIREHLDAAGSD